MTHLPQHSTAQHALSDATVFARRFNADVILARVNGPDEEHGNDLTALNAKRKRDILDLEALRSNLSSIGIRSRGIVRNGIVGDTLFNICCEVNADLLLLGAYGYSLKDRRTLGSTAEYLLRALPCPTLTYGPEVKSNLDDPNCGATALIPVNLPCDFSHLEQAVKIAKLFSVGLEILHVSDDQHPGLIRKIERHCEDIAIRLRSGGIVAQWSIRSGQPETQIISRSIEIGSPFILMPLHWDQRKVSMTLDCIAAHVIRCATVPVMTYKAS